MERDETRRRQDAGPDGSTPAETVGRVDHLTDEERERLSRERAAAATTRTSIQAGGARAPARTRTPEAGAVDAPEIDTSPPEDQGTMPHRPRGGRGEGVAGGLGKGRGSASRKTGSRGGRRRN